VSGRRALLLVDHGSRRSEANALLERIASALAARVPDAIVRVAHLEIEPPDIGAGIDACVAAGARQVVVLPWFLGPGRHTARDIPAQVQAAIARHPEVRFAVAAPLAPHDKLVDVLIERAEAADVD
jgi:sirohydrochlorin ferrochelatase